MALDQWFPNGAPQEMHSRVERFFNFLEFGVGIVRKTCVCVNK
jgi:hypothetical protein